ncbi:MAG TPA: phosphoglycerate dehydrogenase [Candidatus Limnocylindrales bacterium]|nr:phosphoglycerate dehydrogenase [Candidatus Limnocylindrales bacterium]
MARILVVEPVAQPALDHLAAAHETDLRLGVSRDELLGLLAEGGGWDALIVRSQTRVDAELLSAGEPRLGVIGVASVGIDRIDVEAATRAGVMVVNAPTGNTIAAAEHTMALMLSLLRHVPEANASVRAGEWERGRYTGRELRGKTLGIIGLGKIGKAVARRAVGFEMRVVAADPYLTEEQAAEHGAKLVGLTELLHRADVITVHTPLTPQTRGLLGRAQLEATKPGAFVLNVARGGIVDERALADALTSGHLAGAAVDVYSAEPMAPDNPLGTAPNVVLTPHLGASTTEAQDRVGLEMAEQVVLALAGVTPPYAVNAPAVPPETAPRLRPYVQLGRRMAVLARQLAPGAFDTVSLTYAGEIAAGECAPIRTAALAGLLDAVTEQRVNAVNADLVARDRGLTVREERTPASEPWASLVELAVGPAEGEPLVTLAGSTAHGRPHLASLDGFAIDAELAGLMLVTRHHDRPGIVGAVGTTLAEAGINISSLELSRLSEHGQAMMFVSVDDAIDRAVLERIQAVDGIVEARLVELPPIG